MLKILPILKFMHMLANQMANGSAPGRDYLIGSRLTALSKPDGGVRPIATSCLLYRTCVKGILKAANKASHTLSTQFGIGKPGGVEPILRYTERAVDDKLPGIRHHYMVEADLKNAFNEIDRKFIAEALLKHAPELVALASWAYDED